MLRSLVGSEMCIRDRCDWDAVSAIKKELSIPVVLNGGIVDFNDYERAMKEVGVDGVMTSEAILENPALFSRNSNQDGGYCGLAQLARDYIALCQRYDTGEQMQSRQLKYARAHLFKIMYWSIIKEQELCQQLATSRSFADMTAVLDEADKLDSQEPFFNANFHPELGQKFQLKRSWYSRHIKAEFKPSRVTGEHDDLCGLEKWGDKIGQLNVSSKKRKEPPPSIPSTCGTCGAEFPSRSKMFKHLKEEHA
eukprot:TRINITY_DN2958_c0_g1_i5.p1 TRINITY_DN2958_c0_g1~~TRINITY_DN2958_c0_g1_i5.p1  ORF type:complete len:277 (+),score=102.44 TRINITY_DN2958_c0_g1_i5:79-831(+)